MKKALGDLIEIRFEEMLELFLSDRRAAARHPARGSQPDIEGISQRRSGLPG